MRFSAAIALSGTIHKDSATAITLADNTGKLIELSRTDIEELKPSNGSIMPQGIIEKLTSEQLRDLLMFLLVDPRPAPVPD